MVFAFILRPRIKEECYRNITEGLILLEAYQKRVRGL